MSSTLFRLIFLAVPLLAQTARVPLESVAIEDTAVKQPIILEIASLKIGTPIDKAGIEAAAAKLEQSGLFQSINYGFRPGPKNGYAVTFTLADQTALTTSSIDIPGADDSELWAWIASRYPTLNRKAPGNDAGQEFIAKRIEEHLGSRLEGRHIVARLESDLQRRPLVSFQPETLAHLSAMEFSGNGEFNSEALTKILKPVFADHGYTDRAFAEIVELNLRRAYEEHGMYRVRFPSVKGRAISPSEITASVVIEEGPKFTLGDVTFVGDNLPLDAISKVAHFPKGQVANWTQIQDAIWASEKPVKRTGYMNAAAQPERLLKDGPPAVLDVRIAYRLGPLHHFGVLKISGLDPASEARARKLWQMNTGDPYDFMYTTDFFKELYKTIDSRRFKKVNASTSKGTGDHVTDVTLVFEAK